MIKYIKDTRYSKSALATHDRMEYPAEAASELTSLANRAKECDVIGVDEGQFFPDLVSFCEEMANAGKVVIVAALDGTFQRSPFVKVMELIPLSESVVKLNAICMVCYEDAAFTSRLGPETEIEIIGSTDKYIATCRHCHMCTY